MSMLSRRAWVGSGMIAWVEVSIQLCYNGSSCLCIDVDGLVKRQPNQMNKRDRVVDCSAREA